MQTFSAVSLYLFFYVLKLLLKFLNVRVAVVPTAIVHEWPFRRDGTGGSGCRWQSEVLPTGRRRFHIDRTSASGRAEGDLVVESATHDVGDDAIDL